MTETLQEAVEPDAELAAKNMHWAWGLTGIFLLVFGGTFLVGFAYLWLS